MKFLFLAIALYGMTASASAGSRDTTATADSTAVTDSLRVTFIPAMGALTDLPDSGAFSARQFLWTSAFATGDLFVGQPGFFSRMLGSPGLPVHLSAGGLDWRGVSWLLDGRPLTDPVTGVFNLYDIPLEFVDHLEFRGGHESFVYAPNASAAAVNVVSRQYNTGRPVTKIRFMQGPDEHLLTDALFTQNIIRPLNIMIGVQRHTADDRFVNSRYDSWNVRSRIRLNISDRFNLSLTDLYRRSVNGMNNGIDLDSSRSLNLDVFNDAEAIVRSREASETITRRDLTLSGVARVLDDSLSLTHAAVYFSTADRSYSDPTAASSSAFDSFRWDVVGGSLRQVADLGPVRTTLGGIYERQTAAPASLFARPEKTVSAWFGEARVRIGFLAPSLFWRGEQNGGAQGFSYGLGLTAMLDGLTITGGFSESERYPSMLELNWPAYRLNGSGPLDLKEKHKVVEISAVFSPLSFVGISATALRRSIRNFLSFVPLQNNVEFPLIVAEISPEVTLEQFSGSVRMRFGRLEARGGLTLTKTRKGTAAVTTHPELVATGELSYRDEFFDRALDARFVLRSQYVSRHQGVRYLPALTVFAENTGEPLNSFSAVDLFGVFQIGDAFVTLTWENPLDRQFFLVEGYPALGRGVRIGLNWIFLD